MPARTLPSRSIRAIPDSDGSTSETAGAAVGSNVGGTVVGAGSCWSSTTVVSTVIRLLESNRRIAASASAAHLGENLRTILIQPVQLNVREHRIRHQIADALARFQPVGDFSGGEAQHR